MARSEGTLSAQAAPAQAGTGVDRLAGHALSAIARRGQDGPAPAGPDDYVARLCAAVRMVEDDARHALLDEMGAVGIAPEEIADIYIPAAARRLGDAWCVDEVSFTDVIVGTARLQGLLRDLDVDGADAARCGDAAQVLLVVPEDARHTLGAMVAASRLRRMGVCVRLAFGLSAREVAMMVSERQFDMVMISAAACQPLETLTTLVEKVRTFSDPVPPVVIGGGMADEDVDLAAVTGADHVSMDPEEALRFCGLTSHTTTAARAPRKAG